MKSLIVAAALIAASAGVSHAQQASEPKVLSDGVGAKSKRIDGLHGVRYIEIFLAGKRASAQNNVASCYNTTFASTGIPPSKDTSPQTQVAGLDFEKMKKDYGVLGASLNGPKLWVIDWLEIQTGVEREFNGMKAPWVAELNLGKNVTVGEIEPYKPLTIARNSGLGWKTGTQVVLLDDAAGNTWTMKGFELGLKPQYTYNEFLATAASRFKKLPSGWKVRVVTLEKELLEKPEGGVATIMSDEFFNIYDKTGPGMTNYKP